MPRIEVSPGFLLLMGLLFWLDEGVGLLPWGLWGAAGRIGQQQGAVGGAGQRRGSVGGAGQRRGMLPPPQYGEGMCGGCL